MLSTEDVAASEQYECCLDQSTGQCRVWLTWHSGVIARLEQTCKDTTSTRAALHTYSAGCILGGTTAHAAPH